MTRFGPNSSDDQPTPHLTSGFLVYVRSALFRRLGGWPVCNLIVDVEEPPKMAYKWMVLFCWRCKDPAVRNRGPIYPPQNFSICDTIAAPPRPAILFQKDIRLGEAGGYFRFYEEAHRISLGLTRVPRLYKRPMSEVL